ncbi:MAG: GFA family protein [Alphaproteobacteria bacterium]|nr:GFA family protein [Alphaproteobacteria bacterium]
MTIASAQQRVQGACHCGAVVFSVPAETDFTSATRCDCSFCSRRWAPNASVALPDLTIEKGHDKLSLYRWNTGVAKHYFCSGCGIYTFHQRRSDPNYYGVNVGCFDHLDMQDYRDAEITDGIHHPSDQSPDDER